MTDSTAGKPAYGYTDTPLIPGSKWHVHDSNRPLPPVVTPGEAGSPPSDATVLFDGSSLDNWETLDGKPVGWKLENGEMVVTPRTGNIRTRQALGDGQYHVEWAAPSVIKGEGQGRGNSGVFLLSDYEIQVLDNYKNPTYADGHAGAVYGEYPPLVNPLRPPGQWQVYDIIWVGPRFDHGKLKSPARLTLLINGVVVHHDLELFGPTTHQAVRQYEPHAPELPLMLQDHGDLVRFRNIWYRPAVQYS